MEKVLVGVLAGVFVGAFVMEVLHRKKPGLLDGVEERASRAARDFRSAFAQGYRGEEAEVVG